MTWVAPSLRARGGAGFSQRTVGWSVGPAFPAPTGACPCCRPSLSYSRTSHRRLGPTLPTLWAPESPRLGPRLSHCSRGPPTWAIAQSGEELWGAVGDSPCQQPPQTQTQPGKVCHYQQRWCQDSPICGAGQSRLLGGPQTCAPPGTLQATFSSPAEGAGLGDPHSCLPIAEPASLGPAWRLSSPCSGLSLHAGTDSISPSQQGQGNRGKAPAPSQP